MGSNNEVPYIGSYVLETLTTGLYGQSENALREYVQNAFDSVRSATKLGVLEPGKGRIDVRLIDGDALSIKDNGVGIAAAAAWGTLTSIGASKKDRLRDAGFRGIGRLAGIAFCNKLVFKTKAAEEGTETTVTFDCAALRNGMDPDKDGGGRLVDLLSKSVTITTSDGCEASDHYMDVTLSGLKEAPDSFKDIDQVRDYLAETSPIEFDPSWSDRSKVPPRARDRHWVLETAALYVGDSLETMKQVYKIYRGAYALKGGKTQVISEIKHFSGQGDTWWAWVGMPDVTAIVPEERVQGLRVRVKNIQVGGTSIFDEIFASVNRSYARLNAYYIGEVHINPSLLIPNARRDGFEDTSAWRELKRELARDLCEGLAKRAYDLSDDRQKSIEKIETDVKKLVKSTEKYALKGQESEERFKLLYTNAQIREKIVAALGDAIPETQLRFKAQLTVLDVARKRLSKEVDGDPWDARKKIVEQVLEQVLEILQTYLGPEMFSTVRKALKNKVK